LVFSPHRFPTPPPPHFFYRGRSTAGWPVPVSFFRALEGAPRGPMNTQPRLAPPFLWAAGSVSELWEQLAFSVLRPTQPAFDADGGVGYEVRNRRIK